MLSQPLLYLSIYLKAHRAKYYDRLTAIRNDGDWEGWIGFFLQGVAEVSDSAASTAQAITKLREGIRDKPSTPTGRRLIDVLFQHPLLSVKRAAELGECSFATANKALDELVSLGILREITGQKRNRTFRFVPYLQLFDRSPVNPAQEVADARTRAAARAPDENR